MVVADHGNAPVNTLGYLRAMFTVSDIDETLTRLRKHGSQHITAQSGFELRLASNCLPHGYTMLALATRRTVTPVV